MMDDYFVLCPICIETFRSPRLIKECGHSFCEQCLFTYVTTLKDKGELGLKFACPVCRHEVPAPTDNNVSMAWVQSFPTNEDLINKLSKKDINKDDGTEIRSTIFCDPCTAEKDQSRAIKFCISCQAYLCKDCVDVHRKFKVFHNHTLSEIKEVKLMNKVKELAVTTCEKHSDRDIEVYCPRHNIYCCFKCSTLSHNECSGLKEISEMETTAQQRLIIFREKLEIAEKHLQDLVLLSNTSIFDLPQKSKTMIDKLKESRDKIVSAIDAMIEDVAVQTKQRLLVLEEEVAVKIDKMEEIKERCQNFMKTIDVVSEYGLPVHKVLTQTKISKEYVKIEKEINAEENRMKLLDFDFKGEDRLQKLYSELEKYREEQVNIIRQPCDFLRYEDKVRKTCNRIILKTEEHLINIVSDCSPLYTGITVLNDKQLLLCDNCQKSKYCGHVCLYNIESKVTRKLKINSPFSAAVLKYSPSHIAVSVPKDKQIHIISIKGDTMTIEKIFKCDKAPYSLISLDNGLIGVAYDSPPSFDIVDMSSREVKTLKTFTQDSTGRKFKSFKYAAVDELRSHIVQVCIEKDRVYCFDFSGNPVFEYIDEELLSPRGVDIDRDGNIYICSQNTKALHILTPSGCKIKVVKDVPYSSHYPRAIRFDETGNRFWLTNGSNQKNKLFLLPVFIG